MDYLEVIKRIHHFATGECDMKKETRLKLIARECEAAVRLAGDVPDLSKMGVQLIGLHGHETIRPEDVA